jgi:hypothetical protein
MLWNDHYQLNGQHAFLSASKYSWLRYSNEKLDEAYSKHEAVVRGTRLHAFAKECIELGEKLPRAVKTLNLYVNDAIGYKMDPEVVLYYSDNFFGTADAISFRKNFLRIHDLKTGVTTVSIDQLMIYAALFCLEYSVKPHDIGMELRIYQNNKVAISEPSPDEILDIMNKGIEFDKRINKIRMGE